MTGCIEGWIDRSVMSQLQQAVNGRIQVEGAESFTEC